MKKIFISLSLAVVMLFAVGCSCNEAAILSFDNLWGGETAGYTETLVYDVSYSGDYAEYGYNFKKDSALSDFNCAYSGSYTTVTEIVSKENPSIPQEVKDGYVFKFNTSASSVLRLSTYLSITATYSYGEKSETYNDYINTTAYLYNADYAFAPIYTSREFSYSLPSVSGGTFTVSKAEGTDVTVYGEKTYKITKDHGDGGEKEYDYTYKSLIDNSALLTALRNKKIEKDSSVNIPVVQAAYGVAQNLKCTNYISANKKIAAEFNGEQKEVDFAVKGINFVISSFSSSGTAQLVFVQDGATDGIDKSFIVSYVEPIVEYSSYNKKAGAIIYTLKQATYAA